MDDFQIKSKDGKIYEVSLNGVQVEGCTRCEMVVVPGELIKVTLDIIVRGGIDIGGDVENVEVRRNDLLDLE